MNLSKLERKYGKYAIPNITLYLILCYAAGYILSMLDSNILYLFSLDPYRIMHGQIWRLVTWIIMPPEEFSLFTLIMLYFYYSIGTTLERTWGTFRYNVYLLSGMIFTIIGAFLFYGITMVICSTDPIMAELLHQSSDAVVIENTMFTVGELFRFASLYFSTSYICMSIILAFAATFPNMPVYLMMVIPVKMKVLGIIDALIIGYAFLTALISTIKLWGSVICVTQLASCMAILFSMLNFLIFFITTRKSFRTPTQIRRQATFKRQVVKGQKIAKHKCAICGRSEEEYPDLEFRFCSKCDGNYEYCQEHIFTHTHVVK